MLELIGAIFSMLGAFYMVRKETALQAGIFFFTANVSMFLMAIQKGMVPLLIQMGLFMISSILLIRSQTKKLDYIVFLVIGFLIAYFLSGKTEFIFIDMPKKEVLAATTAIIGAFLLKAQQENIRVISYYLFLFADSLYVHIGYERELYFFMCQAGFFLVTSLRGIYISRKENNEGFNKEKSC